MKSPTNKHQTMPCLHSSVFTGELAASQHEHISWLDWVPEGRALYYCKECGVHPYSRCDDCDGIALSCGCESESPCECDVPTVYDMK